MDPAQLLDEAYERLSPFDPEYGGGLADHAPMVVEALVRLGRPDVITGWLDAYVGRLEPQRQASGPAVLGGGGSFPAWLDCFGAELDALGPTATVEQWLGRLTPGLVGAAAHGWLRVAHVGRALHDHDSDARRRELVRGLAYFAAAYQTLPGDPGGKGSASPGEVLASLRDRSDPKAWLITEALAGIGPDFAADIQRVDDGLLSPIAIIDSVTGLLVERPAFAVIVMAHAISAPAALLKVELPAAGVTAASRYAWQAVCGLVSAYQPHDGKPLNDDVDIDGLVDRAIDNGDEHAIKVTEAAIDAVAHGAHPRALSVADRIVDRLGR